MNADCACAMHARSCAGANDITVHVTLKDFGLSRRELEVARLLALGDSNQQIATTLVIGMSTVKAHVTAILLKLQADNRTRAAVKLFPHLGLNI